MTGVQPSKELLVELLQRKFVLESFHFDYISRPRNVVKLGTQTRNMSAHLTACLFFGGTATVRRYWGICKVSYHSEAPSWIGQKGNQHDGHGRCRSVANESGCFLDWKSDPLLLWEINTASWKRCRFSRFGSCQEWAFLTFKVIDYFATKCYLCFHGMYVVMFGGLPLSTYLLRMFFVWFGYSHTVNACPCKRKLRSRTAASRFSTSKGFLVSTGNLKETCRKPSKTSCKSRKKHANLGWEKNAHRLFSFWGPEKVLLFGGPAFEGVAFFSSIFHGNIWVKMILTKCERPHRLII